MRNSGKAFLGSVLYEGVRGRTGALMGREWDRTHGSCQRVGSGCLPTPLVVLCAQYPAFAPDTSEVAARFWLFVSFH